MWLRLRPALVVTRREVRDHFRDWRIMGPMLLLVVMLPLFMNYASTRFLSFADRYGAHVEADQIFPFLLMVVGFFPVTVALVLALESFVGEKERRSIEPLLSSPLSDSQLYYGKLLAALIPALMASYLGMALYLVWVYLQGVWQPSGVLVLQIFAIATTNSLLMVSGAVVVSSQTTSMRAANLLAVFIILPMAVLLQAESAVIVWANEFVLFWTLVGEAVIAFLLIRIGIAHFNREELVSREFDSFDLRAGVALFWKDFRGEADTPWAWYRSELQKTFRNMRLPALLVMVVSIGGLLLGASLADQFVVPADLISVESIKNGAIEGLQNYRFFEDSNILLVLMNNLRTVLIATIVGLLSFGVLALIVMAMPILVIGFFTATIASAGLSPILFLLAVVAPHGILEIPAFILAGAAILRLGAKLASPSPGQTMGSAWLSGMVDWAKIMVGLVLPLLIGAAILEVLVTPRVVTWIFGG
ncbi:MAG: stage II sporulation protein M [Chloroflexota bacterium]|nr:MAG: stage II sporulation protein M [Chloroflexota bacterium]